MPEQLPQEAAPVQQFCPERAAILRLPGQGTSELQNFAVYAIDADFLRCPADCPGPQEATVERSRRRWVVFGPVVTESVAVEICPRTQSS